MRKRRFPNVENARSSNHLFLVELNKHNGAALGSQDAKQKRHRARNENSSVMRVTLKGFSHSRIPHRNSESRTDKMPETASLLSLKRIRLDKRPRVMGSKV